MSGAPVVGDGPVFVLGTAPIGNLFREVADSDAADALAHAWTAGVRHYDTAPFYGSGLSEERLGALLGETGGAGAVISTKVGRTLRQDDGVRRPRDGYLGNPLVAVHDLTPDAIRRGFEDSLRRLGVDRVDTVYLHDPDDHLEQARDAVPVLVRLREEGLLERIGVGTNSAQAATALVCDADLDCVMIAGRWTLLDRTAGDDLLPRCQERRIEVHAAGVFNSGVLATADPSAHYEYAAPPDEVVARARRIRSVCAEFEVPLGAAAIQFPSRHPAVTRVVIGARSVDQVRSDLDWARFPIPAELWRRLDEP